MRQDWPAWPEKPYKGLSFLTEADEALLVGRDDAVAAFLRTLIAARTRLIILHGQSGCGKTSFLRAGIFPALLASVRWRVPRAPAALEPLIARAGTRPLAAIAAALYDLVQQQLPSALGSVNNLLRCRSRSSFVQSAASDPEELTRALGVATVAVPYKLCVVLDQLEEILAARGNDSAKAELNHLGRLLKLLATRHSVLRLVLSMRTEYKGRLDDLMDRFGVNRDLVCGFSLDPLDRASLLEAVRRPTEKRPITSASGTVYPAPFGVYGFQYEKGLERSIVQEICAGPLATPQLLAVQMLCQRLHTYARETAATTSKRKVIRISTADYRDVGGSDDIIRMFLLDAIRHAVAGVSSRPEVADDLTDSVCKALFCLVSTEQDGRVTSVPKPNSALVQALPAALRGRRASRLTACLSSETWTVLRQDRDWNRTGQIAWRLGHDALGLSLVRWQTQTKVIEWERDTQQSHPTVSAAKLDGADLWGSTPDTMRIMTLDDHIWDHQLPLFAQSKGFLDRLGFTLATRDLGGDKLTFAAVLKKVEPFPSKNDQVWVVLLPRALTGTDATWSDFHIWNMYDGFCVVARDTRDRAVADFGVEERWGQLLRLIRDMSTRSVLAYDEQGKDFVLLLARLAQVTMPRINVVGKWQRDVDLMYRYLTRGRNGKRVDYVVGPAPTRALAESVGLHTLVDHRTVLDITERQFPRKSADSWRRQLSTLVLHNTWQVNIPLAELPNWEHIVLPLASVGLHTAEYVQVQPQSFVDFVYQSEQIRSRHRQRLERQAIRTAVTRSYELLGPADVAFRAYSRISPTAYHSGLGAPRVYRRLLELRHECDKLMKALESSGAGVPDGAVEALARRGYNHYRIHNYYHARRFLERAVARNAR